MPAFTYVTKTPIERSYSLNSIKIDTTYARGPGHVVILHIRLFQTGIYTQQNARPLQSVQIHPPFPDLYQKVKLSNSPKKLQCFLSARSNKNSNVPLENSR